jgi:hypothetical protein
MIVTVQLAAHIGMQLTLRENKFIGLMAIMQSLKKNASFASANKYPKPTISKSFHPKAGLLMEACDNHYLSKVVYGRTAKKNQFIF